MKTLSVNVPDVVYQAFQNLAKKHNRFVSEIIRESLGWEDIEIFPKTLNAHRDNSLVTSMAVSELMPNNVIDTITEQLKFVKDKKKRQTLEWIRMRYAYVYHSLTLINNEFIETLDNESIEEMMIIFESFSHFLENTKKTKTALSKFTDACNFKG